MSAARGPSSNEKGAALERLVTSHYEALGYKITPNINLGGHQIDHVGRKYVAGVGALAVMIESKLRTGRPVGVDEVTTFKNTAADLRTCTEISVAIMVTNGHYSKEARAVAARTPWLQLLTLQDLAQDLFNHSESLLTVKAEYESSAIFRSYVPLTVEFEARQTDEATAVLMEKALGPHKMAVLIGDFGSGKTTVLERIFYNLICARLADASAPFPVMLRLRSLLQYSDVWTFVCENLREYQYIAPTPKQVQQQLQSGRLFIILDGFDEIRTGALAADRADFISRLAPLLNGACPCILASRPTYFESMAEMQDLIAHAAVDTDPLPRILPGKINIDAMMRKLDLQHQAGPSHAAMNNIVSLQPLSPQAIRDFIAAFNDRLLAETKLDATQIHALLEKIYDIKDLMRRPLLLDMMMVTIIEGEMDVSKVGKYIGPSDLYEVYTTFAARRDLKVRKDGLSIGERLVVCRELALKMLWKGSIELTSGEIREVLEGLSFSPRSRKQAKKPAEFLERILTDIRVCAFLAFSEDGSLRFTHRSFFEFFVAQAIVLKREAHHAAFTGFTDAPLGPEILYFLGSFARGSDNFRRVILARLNSEATTNSEVSILCRRIAMTAGEILDGARLAGGQVNDATLVDVTLQGLAISRCNLRAVVFEKVRARGWSVTQTRLIKCRVTNTEFVGARLSIDCESSEIEFTRFEDGDFAITGRHWAMSSSSLSRSTVSLSGLGALRGIQIRHCVRVEMASDLRVEAGMECEIAHSMLVAGASSRWYGARSELRFEGATLVGVWINPEDLFPLAEPGRTAVNRIVLRNCRGIIFTSVAAKGLTEKMIVRLRQICPGVHFVDRAGLEVALTLEADIGNGKLEDELDLIRSSVPAREKARREMNGKVREIRVSAMRRIDDVKALIRRMGLEDEVKGLLARALQSPADEASFDLQRLDEFKA
jgi:uncharacterized protein YjbI with pentapeptide repeats